MTTMTGLFTLWRDARLHRNDSGAVACELFLADKHGKKGAHGRRPVEWIRAILHGQQGEIMAPYLTEGRWVFLTLDDLYLREHRGSDGDVSVWLEGKVVAIELADAWDEPSDDSMGAAMYPPPPVPQTREFRDSDLGMPS